MRESPTHLVEELVIVCEHALDELESERLVEVLELEELGALAVAEQAQVLEDGERVARGGAERLCDSVGKCDRFELAGEEHAAILFDDLVDDEHDELAQRRRGSGRYDGGPRLVELETQEQGLRDQRSRTGRTEKVKQRQTHVGEQPAVHGGKVGDEGEEGLEDLELYVDALGHAVVHRLDDGGDGGEGDGAEGDEALEGAEGDGDHFGVFRRAAHEDGAKEFFRMPAICGERASVSRRS